MSLSVSANYNKLTKCRICQETGNEDRGILHFRAKTKNNKRYQFFQNNIVIVCGCYEPIHKFCIIKKILLEQSVVCNKCSNPYLIDFQTSIPCWCTQLIKHGLIFDFIFSLALFFLCVGIIVIGCVYPFENSYDYWKVTLIVIFSIISMIFIYLAVRIAIKASKERILDRINFLTDGHSEIEKIKTLYRNGSLNINKKELIGYVQDILASTEQTTNQEKLINYISTLKEDFNLSKIESMELKINNTLMCNSSKKKDFTLVKYNNNMTISKRNMELFDPKYSLLKVEDNKSIINSPNKSRNKPKENLVKDTTNAYSKIDPNYAPDTIIMTENKIEDEDIKLKTKTRDNSNNNILNEPTVNTQDQTNIIKSTTNNNMRGQNNSNNNNQTGEPEPISLVIPRHSRKNKDSKQDPENTVVFTDEDKTRKNTNNDIKHFLNFTNINDNSNNPNLMISNSNIEGLNSRDTVKRSNNQEGKNRENNYNNNINLIQNQNHSNPRLNNLKLNTDEFFDNLNSESDIIKTDHNFVLNNNQDRELVLNVSDSFDFINKGKHHTNESGFYLNSEEKFLD